MRLCGLLIMVVGMVGGSDTALPGATRKAADAFPRSIRLTHLRDKHEPHIAHLILRLVNAHNNSRSKPGSPSESPFRNNPAQYIAELDLFSKHRAALKEILADSTKALRVAVQTRQMIANTVAAQAAMERVNTDAARGVKWDQVCLGAIDATLQDQITAGLFLQVIKNFGALDATPQQQTEFLEDVSYYRELICNHKDAARVTLPPDFCANRTTPSEPIPYPQQEIRQADGTAMFDQSGRPRLPLAPRCMP
jgi:hypothetical protein